MSPAEIRRRRFLGGLAVGGFSLLGVACGSRPALLTMIDLHDVPGHALADFSEVASLPWSDGRRRDSPHAGDDVSNHSMWIGASRWAKDFNPMYACAFWTGVVDGDQNSLKAKYRIACIKRRITALITSDIPWMSAEEAMAEADKIAIDRSSYLAGLWDGEISAKPGGKGRFAHNVISIKDAGWAQIELPLEILRRVEFPSDLYTAAIYRAVNVWATSRRVDGSPSPYIAAFPLYRPKAGLGNSGGAVLCFRRHKV